MACNVNENPFLAGERTIFFIGIKNRLGGGGAMPLKLKNDTKVEETWGSRNFHVRK